MLRRNSITSIDRQAPRPGIGLALGGGFARAFAQLGVLRVLEEQRIPIQCIAGSSMGSLLGAAYAGGRPVAEIVEKCREIRLREIARWRVQRFGLNSGDRLDALTESFFSSQQFEELAIRTAVVATDLGSGEPLVFRNGSIAHAVHASCAFPGLFEPVQLGTRYLADGGLVAPVPISAAREMGANVVVGVSAALHDGSGAAPSGIFQVVARAVSASQKQHLEGWDCDADLMLRPDVQDLAWDDFERIDAAVEAGAAAARRAAPQIRKLLALAESLETSELGSQGEFLIAEALQ